MKKKLLWLSLCLMTVSYTYPDVPTQGSSIRNKLNEVRKGCDDVERRMKDLEKSFADVMARKNAFAAVFFKCEFELTEQDKLAAGDYLSRLNSDQLNGILNKLDKKIHIREYLSSPCGGCQELRDIIYSFVKEVALKNAKDNVA